MHTRWKSKVGDGLQLDKQARGFPAGSRYKNNFMGYHLPQAKECKAVSRRQRRMGLMPSTTEKGVGEGGEGGVEAVTARVQRAIACLQQRKTKRQRRRLMVGEQGEKA